MTSIFEQSFHLKTLSSLEAACNNNIARCMPGGTHGFGPIPSNLSIPGGAGSGEGGSGLLISAPAAADIWQEMCGPSVLPSFQGPLT